MTTKEVLRAVWTVGALAIMFACANDPARAAAGNATTQEELRLDANAENFSRISDIVVGTHGEIIISLPQDGALRIYDSTGNRVASVGRMGDGPGEFRDVGAVGLKADTIWVQDAHAGKHTYLSLRGDLLRVADLQEVLARITPDYTREYLFVIPVGELPDGTMLAMGTRRVEGQSGAWRTEPLNISPGGPLKRVGTFPAMNAAPDIAFAAEPVWAFATNADRWATVETHLKGNGGSYTLSVFRHTGERLLVREFLFTGVAIPQSQKDSAANAIAPPTPGTEVGIAPDQQSRNRALEKMPSVYPPVQSIVLGMDGTIWLALRDSADVREHIVLDGKGEELGRVKLSTRQRLEQATATRIWVTEKDSTDLTSVVRYRIPGLNPSSPNS